MNKTRERIKNILICVLLLGMVYLTYLVWFFDSPFGEVGFSGIFGDEEENYMIYEGTGSDMENFGIRPMGVFLRDGAGGRGAIYENGAAESLYRAVRDDIAEIMGRTTTSSFVQEKEWTSALLSKGVFLDYSGNIPIESLCLWFGREKEEKGTCARYFMFSAEEKNVTVYAKNGKDGNIVRYASSYPSEELLKSIESLTAVKPATLAAEREEDDFRAVENEMIIMENRAKPSRVSVKNAFETFREETTNACLSAFKLRDGTSGTYSEKDGTVVYVADMVSLRITPDGIVSYTDTRDTADETLGLEVEFDGESPTLADRTETARILATTLAASLPGKGSIYIEDVIPGKNKVDVVFGRTVNGVPVKMKDTSYFMKVQIENKMVKSAKVNLRYYDSTLQTADIFPEQIAAAAVKGKGEKGGLRLFYRDEGESELISPEWFVGQVSDEGGSNKDGMVES